MRMALVGAGGMGGVHLKAYTAMEDIEIAAIADINTAAAKAKAEAEGLNIPVYGSIDDMLAKENIDFVDICTPSYLHEEHAVKAMRKGIHVLCEKPISLTGESAGRMAETAEQNNVCFMVAHVIRFWPQYIYLRKCYDEKTYGKLYHVFFSRVGEIPRWSYEGWMQDINRSGRVPIDLHIHDADFILYMLGKPKYVSAYAKEDSDKISYINACYEYDGFCAQAEGAWYGNPYPFSMSFRCVFEKAVVEYKNDCVMVYENGKPPSKVELEDIKAVESGTNIKSANGYQNEIRYFVDCVKRGALPAVTTPESSADSIRLVEKAVEAAGTGRKITL